MKRMGKPVLSPQRISNSLNIPLLQRVSSRLLNRNEEKNRPGFRVAPRGGETQIRIGVQFVLLRAFDKVEVLRTDNQVIRLGIRLQGYACRHLVDTPPEG